MAHRIEPIKARYGLSDICTRSSSVSAARSLVKASHALVCTGVVNSLVDLSQNLSKAFSMYCFWCRKSVPLPTSCSIWTPMNAFGGPRISRLIFWP